MQKSNFRYMSLAWIVLMLTVPLSVGALLTYALIRDGGYNGHMTLIPGSCSLFFLGLISTMRFGKIIEVCSLSMMMMSVSCLVLLSDSSNFPIGTWVWYFLPAVGVTSAFIGIARIWSPAEQRE